MRPFIGLGPVPARWPPPLLSVAAVVGLLIVTSACGVSGPERSAGQTVVLDPGTLPPPTATARPSPSASAFACLEPSAELLPLAAGATLRGAPVSVRIRGFPPNAAVSMVLSFPDEAAPRPPIGNGTTDAQGDGVVSGVIPTDAPFGDATVTVTAGEACGAEADVSVVGSPAGISIDDDTVALGQSVTITASGFQPGGSVTVILDGDAFDALSTGRVLGGAEANRLGPVRIVVRIPRDLSKGAHYLTANGYSFDGTNDLFMAVDITVSG
jgi:hypothetical protein